MPKGQVLKGQSRQLVLKLCDFFEKENQNGGPLIPFSQVRNRVSVALGISLPTVTKITNDAYGRSGLERNKPSTPKRKRRPRKVTGVDDFDADAIRRHVYDYYLKKEIPTLRKLIVSLQRSGLFHGQKSSLAKVLKTIGFSFKKSDKRKVLMERTDVALSRCDFLRKAKRIQDWTNIVFTDETWLNANHTISRSWTDGTAASTSAVPMGKGERLIICHAGTAKGFVRNALLAFKSKKSGDYHEEMNAEVYEEWFKNMLLSLEEPSTILIDNAPYHSRQIDKMPTQANKKHEIINWLRDNGENVDDSIIPPYHCQYNAIELIWAQVKGHAARSNTSPPFTANKMLALLKDACTHVTAENWARVVERTKRIILSDWDRDIAFDNICTQDLILHITEDSSSDESSENCNSDDLG
ncbi:uncharacterized protein LOC123692673 [Colias croceus]|uniref:uncharacterized protein LOC123692673 n=1 Tax=Colias crocea TaxID=72248 RepID=UPI001E27F447|nr:uncharacterized protein LOC123692673 [Colias croceus]